jgi:hypothetical protein
MFIWQYNFVIGSIALIGLKLRRSVQQQECYSAIQKLVLLTSININKTIRIILFYPFLDILSFRFLCAITHSHLFPARADTRLG